MAAHVVALALTWRLVVVMRGTPLWHLLWLAFGWAFAMRLAWRLLQIWPIGRSGHPEIWPWITYGLSLSADAGFLIGLICATRIFAYAIPELLVHLAKAQPQPAHIAIDAESRILAWDTDAERLFGYPAAEVLGQSMPELIIPPRLRQGHRDGIARYVAQDPPRPLSTSYVAMAQCRRADGTLEECPVEIVLVASGTGAASQFSAAIRRLR